MVATLWWLLCGGYSGGPFWVSTLGVYPVVATLWWLVGGASLGVYSVVSTLGVYSVVCTLWCIKFKYRFLYRCL